MLSGKMPFSLVALDVELGGTFAVSVQRLLFDTGRAT
jgi:hypothetical protein